MSETLYDVDGPLPGPAPPDELEWTSTAIAALSEAVAADGEPALTQAVPLLVWLMRLIVEPRVTPSDGHISGLLGLARVIVRWLGPQGKEAVGLWGLEGIIAVTPSAGGGGRELQRRQRGEGEGLLHHVYHECLFDIATHDNHGPLAPPKCRYWCGLGCVGVMYIVLVCNGTSSGVFRWISHEIPSFQWEIPFDTTLRYVYPTGYTVSYGLSYYIIFTPISHEIPRLPWEIP